MKRFLRLSSAVPALFLFAVLSGFIIAGAALAAANDVPGPSFEGWAQTRIVEGWHSQNITLRLYVDKSKIPVALGMIVEYCPTGEIVMKGWGMTSEAGKLNLENARAAIKLEDGTWTIGRKGEVFYVREETQDDGSVLVYYYVVNEDETGTGRGFPK